MEIKGAIFDMDGTLLDSMSRQIIRRPLLRWDSMRRQNTR